MGQIWRLQEREMDQLAAMRAFARIVESGSFSRAAELLHTPKPTVTKLIQTLEAHLSTKLLNRTTRRITVTPDGAAYYERAMRLLTELEELDSSMASSQSRPRGRLRVDVSSSLAHLLIIPALPDFYAQFPDIQIDLGISDRLADLVGENVDCVLRAGVLEDTTLVARRVAEMRYVTCAAPSYLARHGTPRHPSDLNDGHLFVGYFKVSSGRGPAFAFSKDGETFEISGQYRLAVNESAAYVAACVAGLGIGQAPSFMARQQLASGAVVPILPEWTTRPLPLYVVYAPNRHLSNKLRVFVDWIAGLFAHDWLNRPIVMEPSDRVPTGTAGTRRT
jgi:DNA-binding transcriptional LysR family regulator